MLRQLRRSLNVGRSKRKPKSYQLNSNWLSNSAQIKKYRDTLVKQNHGLCEVTGVKLLRHCLDHDHVTGKCRGVLESKVNLFEGRVAKQFRKYMRDCSMSYADFLIALGKYLNQQPDNAPLHYKTVEQMDKRLNRMLKSDIALMLVSDFSIEVDKNLLKSDLVRIYLKHYIEKLEQ